MTRAFAGLALVVFSATGCSAIASGTELATCTDDAQCDIGNRLHPDRVTECIRYQCNVASGRCELAPIDLDDDGQAPSGACGGTDCDDSSAARYEGNAERCDLVDNDCDLVVDEALSIDAAPSEVPSTTIDAPADTVFRARSAEGGGGRVTFVDPATGAFLAELAGPSAGGAAVPVSYVSRLLEIDPGGVVDVTSSAEDVCPALVARSLAEPPMGGGPMKGASCATHLECSDGDPCNGYELCMPGMTSDPSGCIPPSGAVCDTGFTCDGAAMLCRGPIEASCNAVELDAVRATDGTLLVSSIDTRGCVQGLARLGFDDAMGSGRARSVQAGLGLDSPTLERGLDAVDGCTRDGASGVALATESGATTCGADPRATALAAWIAAAPPRAHACEPRESAVDVRALGAWLTETTGEKMWIGTAGGAPSVVGRTTAWAPPSIAGLEGAGFFVAMAGEAGGVLVRRVAPLGCPPAVTGDLTMSEALAVDAPVAIGDGSADDVRLAEGPSADGEGHLALTYRSGCGSSARSYLAVLTVDLASGAIASGTPIEVSGAERAAARPSAAWLDGPVLLAGERRAPDGDRGAWLVTWVDDGAQDRIVARRFVLDGREAIDDVPFVVSVPPAGGASYIGRDPVALATADGAGFVAYADIGEPGITLRAACGPALE